MSTCDIYTYRFCVCVCASALFICSFDFVLFSFVSIRLTFFVCLLFGERFFFGQFILAFHIRRGDVSNVSYVSQFLLFLFRFFFDGAFVDVMLIHPKIHRLFKLLSIIIIYSVYFL